MEPDWTLLGVSKTDIGSHEAIRPRRGLWTGRLLAIAATLVAVAAIGAVLWIYADVKREILRMSTDIAQIRVSLDLYSRQQPGAAPAAATTTAPAATSSGDLLDLKNRVAILENAWRKAGPGGAPATATLPALPGETATTATPAKTTGSAQNDCLPQDTRFLVTGGDKYPVCGTKGTITVAAVGDGEVTFADGSSIAAGGSSDLKGTQCTLTVISAGADGMAGYAEVRVGC